tara:strand:- start:54 stop:944 length:891 start_codon:yes stop_codon:yes gene_type:complete
MKNYYPKSQIKDNLYTNGDEFVTKNGLVRYEGPYFEVAGENYYTGKDINANSSEELIRLTPDQTNNISQNYIIPEDEFNDGKGIEPGEGNWSSEFLEIQFRKGVTVTPVAPPPVYFYPQPTEDEYEVGEFQRYFVKRINENKYIELSFDDFQLYTKFSPLVQFELYTPIQIPWELTGQLSKVKETNKNIVKSAEKELKITGFDQYFKGKYDQYFRFREGENLYTDGSEFKLKETNEIYRGFYHVHPDKGPMVGKQHVPYPHEYLIPIDEINITVSTGSISPPTPTYRSSGGSSGGY